MPRYIDADLPCVSDDWPTKAELAAERDSEKYNEGHSDGHAIGHDEGRADMHAEVMAIIDCELQLAIDDRGSPSEVEAIRVIARRVWSLLPDAGQGVAGE